MFTTIILVVYHNQLCCLSLTKFCCLTVNLCCLSIIYAIKNFVNNFVNLSSYICVFTWSHWLLVLTCSPHPLVNQICYLSIKEFTVHLTLLFLYDLTVLPCQNHCFKSKQSSRFQLPASVMLFSASVNRMSAQGLMSASSIIFFCHKFKMK